MKQIFSHLLTAVAVVLFLCQCAGINALIKEGQPDDIYAKALEFYGNEKWNRASTLFETVAPVYMGPSREDSIAFYNAHCKYKNTDYDTASQLLDDFRRRFGRSAFIEQAEGMYADCFYRMSPGAERDQTITSKAIIAINEFISRYPESDKVEDFKKINDELTQRLHKKTYLNAYTYYKILRYDSAIVAFLNALKKYPDSHRREDIMYYIAMSAYKFADNSVASKQADRFMDMLDSYYSFVMEYPESKYREELDKAAEVAKRYIEKRKADEAPAASAEATTAESK